MSTPLTTLRSSYHPAITRRSFGLSIPASGLTGQLTLSCDTNDAIDVA